MNSHEEKRDQLIRETFDQCLSGIDGLPSARPEIMKKLKEQPKKWEPMRFRIPAIAAALVVVLCFGILAGTGRLSARPDEVKGGQYTAQPISAPLTQATDPATVLYYNPNGGTYYHIDPNCEAVDSKFQPLQDHFTYAELENDPYCSLERCNVCGAPFRADVNSDEQDDLQAADSSLWEEFDILPDYSALNADDIYLEYLHAGLSKEIKHVFLDDIEHDGLRVDLRDALVQGRHAWFIVNIQDLEGKWIKKYPVSNFYPYFSVSGQDTYYSTRMSIIQSSETKHRMTCCVEIESPDPLDNPDNVFTVTMHDPVYNLNTEQDMLPLVKKYGTEAAATAYLPANAQQRVNAQLPFLPEDLSQVKILDYTHPLDISLGDDVTLTGIGWIDNLLHIQIHNTSDRPFLPGTNRWNENWRAYFRFASRDHDRTYCQFAWDGNDDGCEEWVEFICDCKPEDIIDDLTLTMAFPTERILSSWSFNVPVSAALTDDTVLTDARDASVTVKQDPEIPVEVSMMLDKNVLSPEETVNVSITLDCNTELAGPVVICDPEGNKIVEDSLQEGKTRSWAGSLPVTAKQLDEGKLALTLEYDAYDGPEDETGKPALQHHSYSFSREISRAQETAAAKTTPNPIFVLYYNPNGGTYYHIDPNCEAVDSQFRPLKGEFTFAELDNEPYADLNRCNVCGAPFRLEEYGIDSVSFNTEPEGTQAGLAKASAAVQLSEEAKDILKLWTDEYYDALVPLNLSCESQGVRLDIHCALVKDNKAWFAYTLSQPGGSFFQYDKYDDFYKVQPGDFLSPLFCTSKMCGYLDCSKAENSYTFYVCYELVTEGNDDMAFEADRITMGCENPQIIESRELDLLPLLKEYGKAFEGAKFPGVINGSTSYENGENSPHLTPDSKILDYTRPQLNIPVTRDVTLTGIGWIGGELHVQFHYTGEYAFIPGENDSDPWDVWCGVEIPDENHYHSFLSWDENNDGTPDWIEYSWNLSREDASRMSQFTASVDNVTDMITGRWAVSIPLDDILAKSDLNELTLPESIPTDLPESASASASVPDPASSDKAVKVGMELYKAHSYSPDTVTVAVSVTNNADYILPGPITLYAPDGTEIDISEGNPVLYPGEQFNCVTEWTVTPEQLEEGKITYTLKYPSYGEGTDPVTGDRKVVEHTINFSKKITRKQLDDLTKAAAPNVQLSDSVRQMMKTLHELDTDDLKPLNLSCESNGVRLEIPYGLVTDDHAWFVYVISQPDGSFFNYDKDNEQYHIGLGQFMLPENYEAASIMPLDVDETGHAYATLVGYQLKQPLNQSPVNIEEEITTLTVGCENPQILESRELDLLPLVKEYGKTFEGVKFPDVMNEDNSYENGENSPKLTADTKVLDYTKPQLNIPVTQDVVLTGIGWIDGQLHVQLHYTAGRTPVVSKHNFAPWESWCDVEIPGENHFFSVLYRDENDDKTADWDEYIWNLSQEDVSRMKQFTVSVDNVTDTLNGTWQVSVPLDDILAKPGPDALTLPESIPTEQPESIRWDLPQDDPYWTGETMKKGAYEFCLTRYDTASITAYNGKNQKSVTIPSELNGYKVTEISTRAFSDNNALRNVTIPEGVTRIGISAFSGCMNLESVNLPASLTSVEGNPFRNTPALKSIHVAPGNPVFTSDNNEALIDNRNMALVRFANTKSSGTYEIPQGITKIEEEAFYNCNLTGIAVPESVTTIADRAFAGCTELKELDIGNSVTSLGSQSIMGCYSLESIILPDSLQEIRGTLFGSCMRLKDVKISPDHPVFDFRDQMIIHRDQKKIISVLSTASGALEIPDGIETIDDLAFQECGNLTDITIPDSVKTIGWEAFNACDKNLVIHASEGSAAQQYCNEYGLKFMTPEQDEAAAKSAVIDACDPAFWLELNKSYPDLADELRPVNLSAESDGIRLEILFASMGTGGFTERNTGYIDIVYTLQDLEGNRIVPGTGAIFGHALKVNDGALGQYQIALTTYNQAEHKVTCLMDGCLEKYPQPEDGQYTFSLAQLLNTEDTVIDLAPYLKQYGKAVEGVTPPEDMDIFCPASEKTWPEEMKILDYSQSLDIPLGDEGFRLGGIGWIDGILHVQVDSTKAAPAKHAESSNWDFRIISELPGRGIVGADSWIPGLRQLTEHIADVSPEEADRLKLTLVSSLYFDPIPGEWNIRIPADMITAE